MPAFTTFIQHLGSNSQSIRQEKEKKTGRKEKRGIQIGKEEVKLPLIEDDIILHVENPRLHTHTHTQTQNC